MKTAILTYHRALNYGAVLQAYALETAIRSQFPGIEAGILDYRNPEIESKRNLWNFSWKNGLVRNLTQPIWAVLTYRKRRVFDRFLRKVTIYPISKQKQNAFESGIGNVIVGSDQVWNLSITGRDTTYLLDFIDDGSRKCSYAASMGSLEHLTPEDKRLFQKLKDFSVITVREKSAADFLAREIGVTAGIVLDPVFLLSVEAWSRIEKKPAGIPDRYVFVYGFGKDDAGMLAKAHKEAEKNGAKVIMLKDTLHRYSGTRVIRGIAPEEFLWMIHHAQYIVTNSFHAAAFSILFHKELACFPLKGKSSRIVELLETFGLSCKMYDENGVCTAETGSTEEQVEHRIAAGREEAYKALKEILLRPGKEAKAIN